MCIRDRPDSLPLEGRDLARAAEGLARTSAPTEERKGTGRVTVGRTSGPASEGVSPKVVWSMGWASLFVNGRVLRLLEVSLLGLTAIIALPCPLCQSTRIGQERDGLEQRAAYQYTITPGTKRVARHAESRVPPPSVVDDVTSCKKDTSPVAVAVQTASPV